MLNNQKLIQERIVTFVLLIYFSATSSCKKFVEIDAPSNTTNSEIVFQDNTLATAVMTGLYSRMSYSDLSIGSFLSVSAFPGLSADEFTIYDPLNPMAFYYKNDLTSTEGNSLDFWAIIYPHVYTSNATIDGVRKSTALSQSTKQQLLGEALFIRAFSYFYLVNFYGDVPLITGTDFEVNRLLPRTPKAIVWEQIVEDLKEAQMLLSDSYLTGSLKAYSGAGERVRPTKWAATALLARAYLYKGEWQNAETQATAVINNTALYDTVPISEVFLKNNKEAIWQLQPVVTGSSTNTKEGVFFLPDPSNNLEVVLSPNLHSSFENGDLRAIEGNWINSIDINGDKYDYLNKYRVGLGDEPVTEYSTVLRLGEQYLIRAEARAQLNNLSGSQSDLNIIRNRAGLSPFSSADKVSLLTAILHERQVELFGEWGHRWFDLKRTGNIDAVMSLVASQKGGTWATYKQWYPLLTRELQMNPNLIQNQGYQ